MNPNIAARLVREAQAHPDRLAIVDCRGGRRRAVTYAQLVNRMARTAAGLSARGVSAGDRVLLFVPMSLDLYVALLAILHLGAEAVFVDAWAGRARIDAAIALAKPRAWLGSPRAQWLRLVSGAVRRIPLAVVVGGPWRLRRLERTDVREPAPVAADTTALVTFTTGSTGAPKAAPRSHGFLWAQHEALAAHLQLGAYDVNMPSLPVFVLNNLALGITSVLPDADPRRPSAIRADRVLANMREEGVTSLIASPAFCERLVTHVLARGAQLPLARLFTGGAPVLPPLVRSLSRAMPEGAEVIYGSTEAEPISGLDVKLMLREQQAGRVGHAHAGLCVGTPVPQITLRIMRCHDGPVAFPHAEWPRWELPAGSTGEIAVAGDHVQQGYLDNPEANRENKILDGEHLWHRTGDAGYLDEAGRLWLMGRVSRRVVRDGVTWWPLPAELRAFGVEGVTHAAYVGVPPNDRAVLCVEAPAIGDRASTEAALREAVQPWPLDAVLFLRRIPRDPRHESKTDHARLLPLVLQALPAGD